MKEGAAEEISGRLPSGVTPECYNIRFTIDPEEKKFSGEVEIEIDVAKPMSTITLHALELTLSSARLWIEGTWIEAATRTHAEEETVVLTPGRPISRGRCRVRLGFSGNLNPHLRGLYEAKASVLGKNERYAFTQFEATDARRAFPCFDEPSLKATFKLIAVVPSHLTALSNMPIARERVDGSWKTVEFSETPRMSTYLLALAVARLECEEIQVGDTRVAIWSTPGQLHLGKYALEVTGAVLPLLNDYFGLPYPYPKLDLVAVPDFAMGAMENWGAIFFRDSRLLVDSSLASTQTKRVVANVITHEVVHQWFGNLVTMWWWDDLWLNEAFATWLAVKIVDQWKPEWNSWIEFQQEKAFPLAVDALNTTRPIKAPVKTAAQAEEMFDSLTYEKGAAVLRMIEQFLGEDVFRQGLRRYIADHQYGCALSSDLWRALEAASGQPVQSMAMDWFEQPGFPRLSLISEGTNMQTIIVEQRRYSAYGNSGDREGVVWTVPLALKVREAGGHHIHRVLLRDPSTRVRLPYESPIDWIFGNAEETGFFRTAYDDGLMNVLKDAVPKDLTPAERIGMIDHCWAQTRSGDFPIGTFLDLLSRFRGDSNRFVAESLVGILEILSDRVVLQEDLVPFREWAGHLLSPIWSSLGWDAGAEEDDEPRLARAAVLWGMGYAAWSEPIHREAGSRLQRYFANPASCDPTMVEPLIRLGAITGGSERFDDFLRRFKTAETPEDRDRYLGALGDFRDIRLCRRLLDFTLTDHLRSQDLWKPLMGLLSNPSGQEEAWKFIRTHWAVLRKKGGSVAAQRIIRGARALWRPEWHRDVKDFFENPANREKASERTLAQTLEFILLGIQFKERVRRPFSDWIRTTGSERPRPT